MNLTEQFRQQIRDNSRLRRLVVDPDWGDEKVCIDIPPELRGEGNGEARLAYLNEYVRDHFVHPDVRDSIVGSLDRADVNRSSRWPYIRDATAIDADGKARPGPEHQNPAFLRDDAEKYFASKHLDYKAVTGQIILNDDGSYQIVDVPDDPYPYLNMLMALSNPAERKWTTFGTAELANYCHKTLDGTVLYPDRNGAGFTTTPPTNPPRTAGRVENPPLAVLPAADIWSILAGDDTETVEISDDEYSALLANKAQYDAAYALRAEFCETFGATDIRKAVKAATAEELQTWLRKDLSATQIGYAPYSIATELARRVVDIAARRRARQANNPKEVV